MNTHADKTQENHSQSFANSESQMQSSGKSTFQFVDNRPEAIAQRKLQEVANNSPKISQLKAFQDIANNSPQVKHAAQLQAMADKHAAQQQQPIQKKENNTGLPDNLKSGIENLSGYSMDDVKVHRNSDKPAQLQAHAYAQGTDIHLASGQEKHLPHEAWHVVQQKQGRVKPTMQMKGGINVNTDKGLEKEADVMGSKSFNESAKNKTTSSTSTVSTTIQMRIESNKFNVVGENHQESNNRRDQEKKYLNKSYGVQEYYREKEFRYTNEDGDKAWGDPRHEVLIYKLDKVLYYLDNSLYTDQSDPKISKEKLIKMLNDIITLLGNGEHHVDPNRLKDLVSQIKDLLNELQKVLDGTLASISQNHSQLIDTLKLIVINDEHGGTEKNKFRYQRSKGMAHAAEMAGLQQSHKNHVWKVGDNHIPEMEVDFEEGTSPYTLTTKREFNDELDIDELDI